MHLSIKRRIYLGFLLLVCLFVLNGIVTNVTLKDNRNSSARLSRVVEPSLEALDDFKKMIVESKMYTTNWVFLRSNEEDKERLKGLHDTGYKIVKAKINNYTGLWKDTAWVDSMKNVFTGFENLLVIEKSIMRSLDEFADYDDPVTKFEAERNVEDEVLPRTAVLVNSLDSIYNHGLSIRKEQSVRLENSFIRLRMYIIILTFITIAAAVFLSFYLTKVIIRPVTRINQIIDDLGKGIVRQIGYKANGDEMGKMIRSVNHLSEKLLVTANFAHEVGLRNFNMPYYPLSEDDTLGKALLAMRDNLKKGEASLEIQNKELERKNKELEEFAYVASHDLQEPLRTISSFVELFRKQYEGKIDEKSDKYINYIAHSSTRMRTLITDLLEYSRIGSNKQLQQVDCNVIVKEILADLGTAINETGTVIESASLPVITGYRTEIKQLFQNLIFNAIKFRRKDVMPHILISAIKQKTTWQFAIADNGIGIAKEHYSRIFIIFQRLHNRNEYPGSGIGLSHCKKIVELHKGKIWLESNPGSGTIFYFTI